MKIPKLHYAWIILLAVSLIRGVAGPGVNASTGVFLAPVAESLGIGIGKLSFYLSISSVATLVWLPVAGNLYNRLPVKTVVFTGILLQTVAFIVLGFMNSVWAWYILAVPLAMGAVLLVNLLGPLLIKRWFSKNIGLVMGIMMMITSLLGAVFQPALTGLIEVAGWRRTYILIGVFALIAMLVICFAFLKNTPGDKALQPYGRKEDTSENKENTAAIKTGIPSQKALKSPAFFLLLLFMIVLTGFASFQQHIATFGIGIGLDMTTIGKALSISMIGAAVGSVLIGIFSDKLGIIPTSLAVLATGIVAVVLFYYGGGMMIAFVAATFFHGLATSAIGVVAPLLTTKFFGDLDYEKLFSAVMIGSPLASIILMPAYGFIYDKFGNYNYVFAFLGLALAAAMIGLIAGAKNSEKLWTNEARNK